ncbi:unnamed protein product [Boreogadus saida]
MPAQPFARYERSHPGLHLAAFPPPLSQAPVFISFFIALRKMAYLPVPSLQTGGALWYPDPTMADPFYLLPIAVTGTMFFILELGAESGVDNPNMKAMKTVFRIMPFVILPLTINFPTVPVPVSLGWWWANAVRTTGCADLKNPPTGVSTEGGQTTAASWKWFELMHEAIGDRPSVTPPVLIATGAQSAVVFTAPSTSTPGGIQVEAAEETALGSLTHTTTGTSTVSTPKRRRVDVVEVLKELKSQDEQEWRTMQAEEREREREERREAEQVRQAAEREQREERRYRELCERQERCHQEAVAKEERWREEMRRRDQEAAARDERRDREAAARDERFLAILERMAPK